jgi:hypothetical protein
MSESWIQLLSLFLANAGLILWFRSESRSDWRHMDNKLDSSIKAIQEDMKVFHSEIRDEMKDFHNRLIEIEIKSRLKEENKSPKKP